MRASDGGGFRWRNSKLFVDGNGKLSKLSSLKLWSWTSGYFLVRAVVRRVNTIFL